VASLGRAVPDDDELFGDAEDDELPDDDEETDRDCE
jgi:hypothetical protein